MVNGTAYGVYFFESRSCSGGLDNALKKVVSTSESGTLGLTESQIANQRTRRTHQIDKEEASEGAGPTRRPGHPSQPAEIWRWCPAGDGWNGWRHYVPDICAGRLDWLEHMFPAEHPRQAGAAIVRGSSTLATGDRHGPHNRNRRTLSRLSNGSELLTRIGVEELTTL